MLSYIDIRRWCFLFLESNFQLLLYLLCFWGIDKEMLKIVRTYCFDDDYPSKYIGT